MSICSTLECQNDGYGRSKGTAIYLASTSAFPVFLASADRELSCSIFYFFHYLNYFSGDDFARLCNVEPIQDNSRCPLVRLRTANNPCCYPDRRL